MGGHDDPMAARKNVYVEGIANYRDQMHLRFLKNLRRGPLLPFVVVAVGIPSFFALVVNVGDSKQEDRRQHFLANYKAPESRSNKE